MAKGSLNMFQRALGVSLDVMQVMALALLLLLSLTYSAD